MRDLDHARLQEVANVRAIVEMFYLYRERGCVGLLDLVSQLGLGDGIPLPETMGDPANDRLVLERLEFIQYICCLPCSNQQLRNSSRSGQHVTVTEASIFYKLTWEILGLFLSGIIPFVRCPA